MLPIMTGDSTDHYLSVLPNTVMTPAWQKTTEATPHYISQPYKRAERSTACLVINQEGFAIVMSFVPGVPTQQRSGCDHLLQRRHQHTAHSALPHNDLQVFWIQS
ncbi:hypothetical protein J6590_076349 [Homalodisca vitripennis]|nr:hypothetical protein J6590_076349 [Homalodisca vitripennis]